MKEASRFQANKSSELRREFERTYGEDSVSHTQRAVSVRRSSFCDTRNVDSLKRERLKAQDQ